MEMAHDVAGFSAAEVGFAGLLAVHVQRGAVRAVVLDGDVAPSARPGHEGHVLGHGHAPARPPVPANEDGVERADARGHIPSLLAGPDLVAEQGPRDEGVRAVREFEPARKREGFLQVQRGVLVDVQEPPGERKPSARHARRGVGLAVGPRVQAVARGVAQDALRGVQVPNPDMAAGPRVLLVLRPRARVAPVRERGRVCREPRDAHPGEGRPLLAPRVNVVVKHPVVRVREAQVRAAVERRGRDLRGQPHERGEVGQRDVRVAGEHQGHPPLPVVEVAAPRARRPRERQKETARKTRLSMCWKHPVRLPHPRAARKPGREK